MGGFDQSRAMLTEITDERVSDAHAGRAVAERP
jgi:hypothetical protein